MRGKEVDVVVLAVLMPGKSGIDTLREMKQLKPLTEVIMLTGHATVETAIEGMKLGAYDYLLKPTEIAELVEKISKAHGRKADQEERIRQATIANNGAGETPDWRGMGVSLSGSVGSLRSRRGCGSWCCILKPSKVYLV